MRLVREVAGRGRPVVLLHGGYGLDHTYLQPWIEADAQLIYPDLRGCGRTPREGLAEATLETLCDDLEELRAELGHGRWTVLGHSFGSYVAQEYALRYPDRVEALALVGSTPAFDYPDVVGANLTARGTPEQAALLEKAVSAPLSSDDEFRRGWNLLLPLYFHRFDPGIAQRMDARMTYSAPALFHGFRMLARFNTLARLGELERPVLVATGRHDWITPPAQGADRLARGIPHARVAIFEESGHFPFIEERERFNAVLAEFLRSARR